MDTIDHALHFVVCKTPSDEEGFQGSLAADMSDDIRLCDAIFTVSLKFTHERLGYELDRRGAWRQC